MSGTEVISGLAWGVASHAYPGEQVCGDAHVVAPFDGGVLTGVIDGLGHGAEAARASQAAVASLTQTAGRPLTDAVAACHADLRRTRGAALALAMFHPAEGRMSWIGVGNVEAVLFTVSGRQTIVPRAGVVGYQVPSLRETSLPLAVGDVLIVASDGVSSRFCERRPLADDPEAAARALLDAYGIARDDGMVLVARYLGVCA
ncbi:MAG TPA: SpoIIE family protein phosphatase [Caulobacteraceae bacterium]|jgi:serine phosphatase RsbU (regulator of sigma subunit)|nr:SpoIIE family protein phosphatase [Caulobacteraceae bacterium]